MKEEEVKVIEYTIDDSGYLGVHAMSLVENPAIEVEKLFSIEYVTGNSFSYDDTSNFRAWSATAAVVCVKPRSA